MRCPETHREFTPEEKSEVLRRCRYLWRTSLGSAVNRGFVMTAEQLLGAIAAECCDTLNDRQKCILIQCAGSHPAGISTVDLSVLDEIDVELLEYDVRMLWDFVGERDGVVLLDLAGVGFMRRCRERLEAGWLKASQEGGLK